MLQSKFGFDEIVQFEVEDADSEPDIGWAVGVYVDHLLEMSQGIRNLSFVVLNYRIGNMDEWLLILLVLLWILRQILLSLLQLTLHEKGEASGQRAVYVIQDSADFFR